MKKLIFTTLSTVFAAAAFAQSQVAPVGRTFKAADEPFVKAKSSALGKASTTNTYEPWDFAGKAGASGTWTRYVNFMFPDTLVKYIDENGVTSYGVNATNIGQVLDPKDDNIDVTDNPGIKMSKYTSYSLDSIYINYLYVRNVDSMPDGLGGNVPVVDTLFIDYYTGSGLGTGSLTGGEIFATPDFDMATRRGKGAVKSQTILLTSADSTKADVDNSGNPESAWKTNIKTIAVPAGVNVNTSRNQAQNLVAFSFKFKPGHTYDTSSVMIYQKDPTTLPAGTKRANYFGYAYYSNGENEPYPAQVKQTKFYTNSLITGRFNSGSGGYRSDYPTSQQNAWEGFVPGNSLFAHKYVVCGLDLTTTNLGIKDVKNDNFAMSNVYPNPAKVSEGAVLAFNLKSAANVSIDIFTLMGQHVKSVVSNNFAAGEHAVDVNLSGMSQGVYFVNMTSNGVTVTKKLTITE